MTTTKHCLGEQIWRFQLQNLLATAENTHHWGQYHCTADFLFDWFGFDQTGKFFANSNSIKAAESKQNKQRSVAQ